MSTKKCVLAYSGGLDTTTMIPWLMDRGYEIHAVLVDVGQEEDLAELLNKATAMGCKSAVVADGKARMYQQIIPPAIGLAATYEGNYRLGTALARPFIALEQVRVAKRLGGATLIHGATGKGNDQVRFEFAYRSLAPECPVLAPWKVWEFEGRKAMVDFLVMKGFPGDYQIQKDYSLDENLWHLSVEGGPLEDPNARLDVNEVLRSVANRFAGGDVGAKSPGSIDIDFQQGLPVALNGQPMPLAKIIPTLNRQFRSAPWAWDLIIENRFTGIKSRGLYINPAARLLHLAADALARTCFNKPTYDYYGELGREWAAMVYRGEFFSDQRLCFDAAASKLMEKLNGSVTIACEPVLYAARVAAERGMFQKRIATFEKTDDFSHADAGGFIRLSWMSRVGRTFADEYTGLDDASAPASAAAHAGQSASRVSAGR